MLEFNIFQEQKYKDPKQTMDPVRIKKKDHMPSLKWGLFQEHKIDLVLYKQLT